jgi:hypothetical protein
MNFLFKLDCLSILKIYLVRLAFNNIIQICVVVHNNIEYNENN